MSNSRELAELGVRLAVFGVGAHCDSVVDALDLSVTIDLFDDQIGRHGVIGDRKALVDCREKYAGVHIAIGDNLIRLELQRFFVSKGLRPFTIVHPTAYVSETAVIGAGSLVLANAVVGAKVVIGRAVIINNGAIVDHRSVVGDGSHVCPGAKLAGGVKLGELATVGLGATVIQGVEIGSNAICGAGSTVLSDVDSGTVITGVHHVR